ncbi:MAG: plastocyanin/azurin family copper-binding protein [Nitrosopumilus sp.]|nr:plastocyanin/azurin family copper-binding protein [Nitrosopumilus sp.]MDF2426513.1 plastocyanin/azurin family copper-binding protein [Nitrosopumilus sp.]MDF2430170.1 plastocyanin/azurin family copper-binding protein [Nitrosopumilus sp.]
MSHDNSQVYRTTPARTGKMMIIMLGICIVGGAIFFSMWDYWISEPAPVVAMMAGDSGSAGPAAHTGATIMVALSFVESSDFRTMAFNALPGEPDNNPTINIEVGDKVVFDVVNDGVSFHAFGVTQDEEGFGGIIPGSEIMTASNPLKAGQSGTSEYIAGEEGVFYYICTVPGHREQGMVGKIVVGDVSVEEEVMEAVPEPEVMEEVMAPEPEVTEEVMAPEPVAFDGMISLPEGSGVPGCDDTNECYIPYHVTVSAGEEITWSNDDSAAHSVTSGLPGAPDGIFDSSLFMAGGTFSVTLDDAGEYPYYCVVHPWMKGMVTVN